MTLFSIALYGIPGIVAAVSIYVASKGFKFYWETIIHPVVEGE